MTKYEIEQYGIVYLESQEFKEGQKRFAEQISIQEQFLAHFTPEFISHMGIDDYAEGKNSTFKQSFCYILEFQLEGLGMIRGSYALPKFGLIYSEEKQRYLYYTHSKFGNDETEIFENIRKAILDLIEAGETDDYDALESNPLSPMFKGKIYYVYFSDKALPIYSEDHLDFFIRALDIPCPINQVGLFEKRRLIVEWKNESSVFKKMTTLEFMGFLYSSYGFKRDFDILKSVGYDAPVDNVEVIQDKDAVDRVIRKSVSVARKPNYEDINRKKTAVGISGEDFVLRYEQNNNKKYAKKIIHVSEVSDSEGYDVLSYDENGNEKHIEVKTSVHGDVDKIDFFITKNEYDKLQHDSCYMIYYVCGINRKTKTIIVFKKENLSSVSFEPIIYKITASLEEQQK